MLLNFEAQPCARARAEQKRIATLSALMSALSPVPALDAPLLISRAEILSYDGHYFSRVQCGEFWGVAALSHWTPALISLWQTVVTPFWIGRDARALEADIEVIYLEGTNYKLAGAPFWSAVAGLELAIWDALGQAAGRSVAAMLCDKPKSKLPVYLSSLRRDTDAPTEVQWLAENVERSGARAVKIKVGGRMKSDDQTDARDAALLRLAREKWGEKFTLYADANGSFGAEKAVEVGQLLEQHKVAWFEEPCPWEDFEATRTVAASVQLPVAGGEQDSSWPKWKWLLEGCALDVAQPDLNYNGGLLRSFRLAQFAGELGVVVAPHSPQSGPQALAALHFAAALPNGAPFLEWDATLPPMPAWFETSLEVVKGAVSLPKGAGWGAVYDAKIWESAEILAAASV